MSQGTVKQYQNKGKYIEAAHAAEKKYGIPRNTLVGLLGAESNFNPNAVSPVGAKGIAQFMKATAQEYGINPLDPFQSIDAAGKYLSKSYKKFGNWEDSLRSYNLGIGGVEQWKAGKRTLPKETADYVGRVYKKAGINYEEPSYINSVAPYMGAQQESPSTIISTFQLPPTQPISYLANPALFSNLAPAQAEATKEEETIQKGNTQEQDFMRDLLSQVRQGVAYVEPEKSQVFQDGGIIKDDMGQWAHPGEITQIASPTITMKGVNQSLLGVADTGERKILEPENEYYFEGAKTVTEIPLTQQEENFLKDIYGTNEKN